MRSKFVKLGRRLRGLGVDASQGLGSVLALSFCFMLLIGGCRGRAHEDVYRQKMVSEMRVLEDQLYAADYENRVLADKLEQARSKPKPSEEKKPKLGRRIREKLEDRIGDDDDDLMERPASDVLDVSDVETKSRSSDNRGASDVNFDVGDIDMGTPDASIGAEDENGPYSDSGSLFGDFTETVPPAPPVKNDSIGSGATRMGEAESSDSEFLMPAPGGPEPPGIEDTQIDPIIPGDVAPPSEDGISPDAPPGQIKLEGLGVRLGEPESVEVPNPDMPLPTELQLHPGFSGRHRFPKPPPIVRDALVPVGENLDSNREGMMLVVNVLDQNGRMMDLSAFDIDADMTVAAYDAKHTDRLLDTWKFTPREVKLMVRTNPVSGFHVPVRWSTPDAPTLNVLVKVRLQAGTDVMTCEAALNVSNELSASRWTPRGDSKTKR